MTYYGHENYQVGNKYSVFLHNTISVKLLLYKRLKGEEMTAIGVVQDSGKQISPCPVSLNMYILKE